MHQKAHFKRWLSLLLVTAFVFQACNLFSLSRKDDVTPEEPETAVTEKTGAQPEEATDVPPVEPTATQAGLPFAINQAPRFAVFEELNSAVVPFASHEPIAADLNNVRNPFILSQSQAQRLVQDGFVVSPGMEKEFFTVYEKARYENIPIFVTSDALLHVYHLMFDKVLRQAETQHFVGLLQSLNAAMLAKADENYQTLRGVSDWEDAARRVVAFFAVGSKLLDPAVSIPDYARDLVDAELVQIGQADGIKPSPIFPGLEFGEDYTQYIPRGHYTRSEILKAYFRSMMWYGRMTFRLHSMREDVGKAETRQALLVVYALRNTQVNGRPALDAWADLYAPTVFFVGRSDDLTAVQYGDVIDYVYGDSATLQTIADESKLSSFIEWADQLPPPKILGIVVEDTADETRATKGLRFMGQRFVPDAYVFRQLIYDNVGTRDNRRGLPKGLDLFAAMNSERAYQHLEQMGDVNFEGYPDQMQKMRAWMSGLTPFDWTETLYNTWIFCFYPLLEKPADGYPDFMRSGAWQDKQLNTSLGSWAELKHDTILYAKQVYAELGGGPPPPPPLPPKGYVEPAPLFYARLAALTAMTRKGLESRGLLNEQDQEGLKNLEDLVMVLQVIAGKELRGEPLTDDEFERIRYIGGELENLTMLAADTDTSDGGPGATTYMDDEQQAAVIADVATDPGAADGPKVLEVGVGRINEIFVVTPIIEADGSKYLQVAKGGVFSYYEFEWPASNRLTDETWRKMLEEGKAPALLPWTSSFMVTDTEFEAQRRGISGFQDGITYIYWDPKNMVGYLEPAQQPWSAELEALNAQNQYIAHQLVSSSVRSFDMQSSEIAVVTVREVWQDKLYTYSGGYPTYDEQPTRTRGPYTLNVTYTLKLVKDDYGVRWAVENVAYADQPPAW